MATDLPPRPHLYDRAPAFSAGIRQPALVRVDAILGYSHLDRLRSGLARHKALPVLGWPDCWWAERHAVYRLLQDDPGALAFNPDVFALNPLPDELFYEVRMREDLVSVTIWLNGFIVSDRHTRYSFC